MPAGLHWDEWASNDEGITGDELLAFIDQNSFPNSVIYRWEQTKEL